MIISSRTPEGAPNRCPVCGAEIQVEPSRPPGDAPCPNCGQLLWFCDVSIASSDPEVLVVVFSNSGVADNQWSEQIGQELQEVVPQTPYKKLLLNFRGVSFMSSAMLSQLVTLNQECKAQGVALKFCEASPNVMEVFKITKLNKLFDILDSEDKAIASYGKKGWFG
ncbi:STAS domain-containing protein [Novipirellula sp. SH528]|uniref:STAS domain-containing protein n=1 Tax=Novipirellula sp. SH528 TaxID=3454466 RepID=UPI003FA03EE9